VGVVALLGTAVLFALTGTITKVESHNLEAQISN
jgi:hypothetical protein